MRRKRDSEGLYAARRKRILENIQGEAALFCSAPIARSSRDVEFPYQPNTDLFYLTGIDEPECALLIVGSKRGPRTVLFLRDRNPSAERWQGERLGIKRAKRRYRVDEVLEIEQLSQVLSELVTGSRTLHYALGSDPQVDSFVWQLFQAAVGPRLDAPHTLKDSRLITSEMRFIKERDEIRTLRHAVDLTAHAFLQLIPELRFLKSELHAAKTLESYFAEFGASAAAFPTTVASGKNATVLHHVPQFQPLWRKELVLIDAGARFRGYCADITRTLPASGKFSSPQAAVYDAVLGALGAGVRKARRESTLRAVHEAVVDEITRALVDLRVLRGSVPSLVEQEKYKPYFMHRASHWLGLDVHDTAPVTAKKSGEFENSWERPLVAGNVFTLEPGLYFDVHDRHVPVQYRGIGVRIEEDLLVTEGGVEILSAKVPVERKELEALME